MSLQRLTEEDDIDVVVNQPPTPAPPPASLVKVEVKYPSLMLGLAIMQLLSGIFSIGSEISTVILSIELHFFEYGPGIWCGILYCVSGSFGIKAVRSRKRKLIYIYMILSIVSAAFCAVPVLTYTLYIALGVANEVNEWSQVTSLPASTTYYDDYGGGYYKNGESETTVNLQEVFMWFLTMLASVFEAIFAITSSVFCYQIVGCCKNNGGSREPMPTVSEFTNPQTIVATQNVPVQPSPAEPNKGGSPGLDSFSAPAGTAYPMAINPITQDPMAQTASSFGGVQYQQDY